jgi:hypothetical protein
MGLKKRDTEILKKKRFCETMCGSRVGKFNRDPVETAARCGTVYSFHRRDEQRKDQTYIPEVE